MTGRQHALNLLLKALVICVVFPILLWYVRSLILESVGELTGILGVIEVAATIGLVLATVVLGFMMFFTIPYAAQYAGFCKGKTVWRGIIEAISRLDEFDRILTTSTPSKLADAILDYYKVDEEYNEALHDRIVKLITDRLRVEGYTAIIDQYTTVKDFRTHIDGWIQIARGEADDLHSLQ